MDKQFIKRDELEAYICGVMGLKSVPPLVNKHIQSVALDYDQSFWDILQALKWWVEVRKQTISATYGFIALYRYNFDEYKSYAEEKELDQLRREQQAKDAVQKYQDSNNKFQVVKVKKRVKKVKQVSFD